MLVFEKASDSVALSFTELFLTLGMHQKIDFNRLRQQNVMYGGERSVFRVV